MKAGIHCESKTNNLLAFSSSVAFVQPATKADIQALELKMIATITERNKRLNNQIVELDKRLTKQIADIDKRLTRVEIKVDEMDKRLTDSNR